MSKEEKGVISQIYKGKGTIIIFCKKSLICIKNNITYQNYNLTYSKLTKKEKEKLVSLLSNQ